jgi:prevent-host-death family protein
MKAQPKSDWQVQTAKARFSEVFRKARTEGPQIVTRQGKESVTVIATEELEKLRRRERKPKSLVQFLRESPWMGVELDLERDKDPGRDIEL